MTTPISSIDNTTLLNLTPNLDIGDVADPALRLTYFQYLNVYIQTITTAFNAFVANGAVGSVNLADLSVLTAKIAELAVTTGKIADLAVTTAKLAEMSVTLAKMAANSVGTIQLVNLAVTSDKIALHAVGVAQLSPEALVNETINNALITALKADVLQRMVNICSSPYSADRTGVTDILSALVAADTALSTLGGTIYIPDGLYKLTAKFSTSTNVHILMSAGATIRRGANGYMFNLGIKSSLKGGTIDANGVNFTGDLIEMSKGSNVAGSEGLQVMEDVNFINFDSIAVNYTTANKANLSKIVRCNFSPYTNSATSIKWPDEGTTGGNRYIIDCYSQAPLVDLNGCDNGVIRGNTVGVQVGDARGALIFSTGVNASKKVIINGNRFANSNTLTFKGTDHVIDNNEFASLVGFDAACANIKYSAINTDSGFTGTVPFATNYFYTKGEANFTVSWTSSGTTPVIGNADVRARYLVEGRTCKVRVQITFGSTSTYGTNGWRFSIPIASTTTTNFTGTAFVGNGIGLVFGKPSDGYISIYTVANALVSSAAPIAWASGNILEFEYEYNLA